MSYQQLQALFDQALQDTPPLSYEEYIQRFGDLFDPISRIPPTKQEYQNGKGYQQRYPDRFPAVN